MRGRARKGLGSGDEDNPTSWSRPDGEPEVLGDLAESAVPAPLPPPARPPAKPPRVIPPAVLRGGPDDTGPWSVPAELSRTGDDTIRAAGGVVWTRWGDGRLRILLVHRPKYDDWSLPKGKADPGETDLACALREVQEETGLSCSVGEELPTTTYLDRRGRPKTVRYFAMQPMGGAFSPHDEVDAIRWLPVDEATRLLSYEHDATIVAALIALLEQT